MVSNTASVAGNLECLFRTGTASGLKEGQILARFASRTGADDGLAEAAFAALVDRHGGMVLRACRGILGDQQAAEDAAQAAFLVLALRARSIARRDSVAA